MRVKHIGFIIFLIWLLNPGLTAGLLARSYEMPALRVDIRMLENGVIEVEEQRSFRFNGRYSEAFRSFPASGHARFSGFRITEQGREYRPTGSGEPWTSNIKEREDQVELIWNFEARDTTRIFHVHFMVSGAIQRFQDAAVFYYQVISSEWDQAIGDISVYIHPPKGHEYLSYPALRQWWHGSLDIESEILPGGLVHARLSRLPARRYMEVRALYPPEVFSGLPPLAGNIVDEIMEEEARWAEEANLAREQALQREQARQQRYALGRSLVWPLAALVIAFWAWLFMRYRKAIPAPEESFQRGRDKPESAADTDKLDQKPVMVSYLYYYETLTAGAMQACLFDLASRNLLAIVEKDRAKRKLGYPREEILLERNPAVWEQQKALLDPHEKMLMSFLFEDMAMGQNVLSMDMLKRNKTKTQAFFSKWKKACLKEGRAKNWFDEQSRKGRKLGLIVAMAGTFLSFLLLAWLGPWMLIVTFLFFMAIFASLAIFRLTPEGRTLHRQWKQARRLFKRFAREGDHSRLSKEALTRYVVYGTALGVSVYSMKRLFTQLNETQVRHWVPWMVIHSTRGGNPGDSLGRIISTSGGALSSSTGSSGGGTTGGGGGVSSGGGGAR